MVRYEGVRNLDILHWTIGAELSEYLSEGLRLAGRRVRWVYVDQLGIPDLSGHAGLHHHMSGHPEFLIAVRRDLSVETAGPIIAHELTHEVLATQGFPTVAVEPAFAGIPGISGLVTQLRSCLSDVVIDRRLSRVGISQDFQHQHAVEAWERILVAGIHGTTGLQVEIDALDLLSLSLVTGPWFREIRTMIHSTQNTAPLLSALSVRQSAISEMDLEHIPDHYQALTELVRLSVLAPHLRIITEN